MTDEERHFFFVGGIEVSACNESFPFASSLSAVEDLFFFFLPRFFPGMSTQLSSSLTQRGHGLCTGSHFAWLFRQFEHAAFETFLIGFFTTTILDLDWLESSSFWELEAFESSECEELVGSIAGGNSKVRDMSKKATQRFESGGGCRGFQWHK